MHSLDGEFSLTGRDIFEPVCKAAVVHENTQGEVIKASGKLARPG